MGNNEPKERSETRNCIEPFQMIACGIGSIDFPAVSVIGSSIALPEDILEKIIRIRERNDWKYYRVTDDWKLDGVYKVDDAHIVLLSNKNTDIDLVIFFKDNRKDK